MSCYTLPPALVFKFLEVIEEPKLPLAIWRRSENGLAQKNQLEHRAQLLIR
jgi:hypothetical protein